MPRLLTAELDLQMGGPVDVILQIAAARRMAVSEERLSFSVGDTELAATEIEDAAGNRIHRLVGVPGTVAVRYRAVVPDAAPRLGPPDPNSAGLDAITYLRPSRYAQSDEVFAHARRQFRGLGGADLIAAVGDYVAASTSYSPGLSLGTDSAVTTLASGHGVCRDYAHLVIALLRALDVPARYAACYAPGLRPMDFHAVAEAYLDGCWYAIDATRLANRRGLVRIATGRDAADCAFLSYYGGNIALTHLRVDAESDGASFDPAADDPAELVSIA